MTRSKECRLKENYESGRNEEGKKEHREKEKDKQLKLDNRSERQRKGKGNDR